MVLWIEEAGGSTAPSPRSLRFSRNMEVQAVPDKHGLKWCKVLDERTLDAGCLGLATSAMDQLRRDFGP